MKLIKKLQHYWKLTFGPSIYYYKTRTSDEAAFWFHSPPCRGVLLDADSWPSGNGRRYLAKMIFVRWIIGIVLPSIFFLITGTIILIMFLLLLAIAGGR